MAIILLVLSYQTVNARIINVPADSSTIQKGINGANSGDTVLVARGTYYENIDFKGGNILVASNYILDRLQATIDSTIINGGGLGHVVKMQSVIGANAGIIGFTITNGYGVDGGGIYCYLSSARISHNVITGDTADQYGGGISVWDSSPMIDSNQILNNKAYSGGGISSGNSSCGYMIIGNLIRKNHASEGGGLYIRDYCSLLIQNNTIDSNTVVYYGGGIHCSGGSFANIIGNEIAANDASSHGGGIYCESSSPTIERNTIRQNESGDLGGGIIVFKSHAKIAWNLIVHNKCLPFGGGICSFADTSSISNNTIDANSANWGNAGGGIHCEYSAARIWNNIITNSLGGWGISCFPTSNPYISHNDVWDNYDGNFNGCPPGVGDTSWSENCNNTPCDSFFNISMDPLFDPDSTNYFLLCNSPCIDAGDPSDPVPEGGGRYIDMGAVEYPYLCGDANGDGKHTAADVVFKINYLFINGPAPCPLGAADDNRDCKVDAADIVYEINYLFIQGPPPVCGGKEPSLANPLSKLHPTSGLAEISLSEPKFMKDGFGEITITGKFDIELAAIQLAVNYDPKEIELIEPALSPRCEGLQIYFSAKDGQLKVGILDINGKHRIPAGEGPILTLKAKAKNLSSLKISEAILVDQNANAFLANIVENFERATSLPDQYSLHQNYPNPFNPETQISYDLPNDSWVKLSIYNIRGQKVKTLVDGFEAAGHKTVIWDGKNEQGDPVASGVYFYRLDAGEFTATKKMVILR